jgi:vacuolar-type H+-ATPase subunit I/STV1
MNTKIDKSKLERYAELKIESAKLKAEIDELNPLIQLEMEESNLEEIESDYGHFFFKKKREWEYPQNVVELEEKYKAEKKKSEQLGTATYQEVNVLNFKTKNEDTKNQE